MNISQRTITHNSYAHMQASNVARPRLSGGNSESGPGDEAIRL